MTATFDGIILGTGHNALVLQAYLSRCGLRVISLDRAHVSGGGLATDGKTRLPGVLRVLQSAPVDSERFLVIRGDSVQHDVQHAARSARGAGRWP